MITTIKNDNVDYPLVVSDKVTGSLFRNVSTGINTPLEITVRHQDYVDSKTKKPGRRSVVRKDVYTELSDGVIAPVSVMIIAMVPRDTNVTSGQVSSALSVAMNMHAGHTPDYTDIGSEVMIAGGQ